MTTTLEQPQLDATEPKTIEKVAIVISQGSLEGIYPGLIMANGARMEGIEADLFFTFFGLDAIRKDRYEKIKVATVGNPGMHMATWLGADYQPFGAHSHYGLILGEQSFQQVAATRRGFLEANRL